jgi:hypothetical protein
MSRFRNFEFTCPGCYEVIAARTRAESGNAAVNHMLGLLLTELDQHANHFDVTQLLDMTDPDDYNLVCGMIIKALQ